MIRILGTTRNEFFSGLIRDITKEPISHIALQVGDHVIHSDRRGVVMDKLSDFVKKNGIICSARPRTYFYVKQVTKYIQKTFPKYIGRKYDFFALWFMAFRFILRLWFKIPLPKDNLWNVSNMYICTELVNDIAGLEAEAAMLTPLGLIEEAIATKYWIWEKRLDNDN